jgi:hypothetical protein
MRSDTAAAAKKQDPTEPGAIERRGNWFIIGGDTTGKRCACRCAQCQHVTLIGREALESGVNCPGCLSPRSVMAGDRP